jgi:SAM-dependent methyltransferase
MTAGERGNAGRPASSAAESSDRVGSPTRTYWENVWSGIRLPRTRDPRSYHELHALFSKHLPRDNRSFIEIGCAPGSWMAYFARHFGYRVTGVEYADKAHALTLENLHLLHVRGEVVKADFFEYSGGPFDIVFSSGFVEHFPDPEPVFERLAGLCGPRGITITMIPSMSGLNWWISRTFRPGVASRHFPISQEALVAAHEARGFRTLCVRRYGCLHVTPPFDNSYVGRRWPGAAAGLRMPFQAWNAAVSLSTRILRRYPQTKAVYGGVVYMGRREE